VVRVISFGRVIWLLEKAGISPFVVVRMPSPALSCAENVTRFWMIEHSERSERERDVSFPGEIAMPVDLSLVAIWVCAREYGGIWRHGKESGPYKGKEELGCLGDMRMATVRNIIASLGGVRLYAADRPPSEAMMLQTVAMCISPKHPSSSFPS
jgi:hypothetical protein